MSAFEITLQKWEPPQDELGSVTVIRGRAYFGTRYDWRHLKTIQDPAFEYVGECAHWWMLAATATWMAS